MLAIVSYLYISILPFTQPPEYQNPFSRYHSNYKEQNRLNGLPDLLLSNHPLLMFQIMYGVFYQTPTLHTTA